MQGPEVVPTVRLSGENGDAFHIMGLVSNALRDHGADREFVNKYFKESTSGNYDHLVQTAVKYVNVV